MLPVAQDRTFLEMASTSRSPIHISGHETARVPLKFLRPILCYGLLLLGAACGDDDFVAPEVIDRIDLSLGDCAGLQVGETCQLEVVVRSQSGSVMDDAALTWRTPDFTIATVDFEGRVTGHREGSAEIFVQSAPGPNVCQFQGVVCDSQIVAVTEPEPGPGPQP